MFKIGQRRVNKMIMLIMGISLLLTAVVFLGRENIAYASEVTVSAETDFTFNEETGSITKYIGSEDIVVIPSTINGVSVTSIGTRAFESCSSLISITIPSGVTSLGYSAFANCVNLKYINLPNTLKSTGECVFLNCTSLENIEIPNSVTHLGSWAFQGCSSLTSITIPNSISSIGYYTFSNCSSLKSIYMPDSITVIWDGAFDNSENILFYVDSEKVKELLIDQCIDESRIILSGQSSVVDVIGVTLSSTTLNIKKGNISVLTATVLPSNASIKAVKWQSSNTGVATVDTKGMVTAVGVGTATITCTSGYENEKTATCVVTVADQLTTDITSISLNTEKLNWTVGKTGTFTAKVLPSNAANKAVVWQSSNTKVATVSATGKLNAVGVGTATITCIASDGSGKKATCLVTVTSQSNDNVTSSVINKPKFIVEDDYVGIKFTVNESGIYLITGKIYNANGTIDSTIAWDDKTLTAGEICENAISDILGEMTTSQYAIFEVASKNNKNSVAKSEKATISISGIININSSNIIASAVDKGLTLKSDTNFKKGIYTLYAYINNTDDCYIEDTECYGNTSSLNFQNIYSDFEYKDITSIKLARIYDVVITSNGSLTSKVEISKKFLPAK